MRKRRPLLTTLTRLLTALILPAVATAQAQPGDAIGIVLAVTGQVEAMDASGAVRALRRGTEVFASDTVAVGPDAFAQIRMVDDAMVSLKSDTAFTFNSYDFDGNPATADSATMTMIRGGFRTISGSIGDADEDTYRVDTPHASIGIRGTTHSAVIVNGTLYTGVYDGGTTISNNQGSIDAGIGANFDYTETIDGEAPRGLVEAPPVLALVNLAPRTTQGADTAADDGAQNSQNGNAEPAPDLAALANGETARNDDATANVTAVLNPAANTDPASTVAATITGGDPQDDVNPARFSRGAAELDDTASAGNDSGNGGNNGNSNAGGNSGNNGNSNAGGNSGNNGNSNAGGNSGNNGNGNTGGNSGNNSNGNTGGNSGNNGNSNAGGNSGNNGNAGGNSGNNGNGNAGGNSGNNGNGNAGGNSGNNGNGNDGGNSGNSGNGNDGSNSGNNGNGNTGGNSGSNGNSNAGGNTGNNGNGNAGGNTGNNGNNNTGGNSGNNGNNNTGGNTGNNGSNGNNGNPGRGNGNSTFTSDTRALTQVRTEQMPRPDDALVLAWGVWDSATPVAQNSISRIIGLFFNSDAERAVVVPANMADLSGTVSYASAGKFAGADATGTALRDVQMTFDVNLAGGPGAITNGQLRVLDSQQKTWSAAFDGSVTKASAIMTNVAGTYADKPLSGSIQGIFTGTGARPDFVSGFVLQSDGAFVQGITELASD